MPWFDGYETMNTKDMTHQRQSKGKAGATVTVAASMMLTMKKEEFLATDLMIVQNAVQSVILC